MNASVLVEYRRANVSDAQAVATLHADSWRRHYRGAYSDRFLDGDVTADRMAVWTELLGKPQPDRYTVIAETAAGLAGFAHTVLDADPAWGALLDNLHVTHRLKGHGIGTRLMAATARFLVERRPRSRLYLWVLEQNKSAQAFYTAKGGVCVERGLAQAPGGDPARLAGAPVKLRYAWPEPAVIFVPRPRI